MEVFYPPLWLMVAEIIVGVIAGKMIAQIKQTIGWMIVVGFFVSLFLFVNQNLTELQKLGTTNDFVALNAYVTTIIVVSINFILHLLFFEIGGIPTSAYASRNNQTF